MTTGQLRKHVNIGWVAVACAKAARDGALVRLGGGAHSSIYGLPGQKLATRDAGAVVTVPAKRKKTAKAAVKRSAPERKVQRNTATSATPTRVARPAGGHLRIEKAALRTTYAAAAASAFRAAIASDGAMLFLGAAAGAFELNRGETRALIDFVRTLDGQRLGA